MKAIDYIMLYVVFCYVIIIVDWIDELWDKRKKKLL